MLFNFSSFSTRFLTFFFHTLFDSSSFTNIFFSSTLFFNIIAFLLIFQNFFFSHAFLKKMPYKRQKAQFSGPSFRKYRKSDEEHGDENLSKIQKVKIIKSTLLS